MALPTFSKTGMTTLTFSRDVLLPYQRPVTYHRVRKVSGGGVVRIAKTGSADRLIRLRFEQLLPGDYTTLAAWFDHANINEGLESFTYTDSASVAYTVYWWDDTFDMPEQAGGLYSVELTLRRA